MRPTERAPGRVVDLADDTAPDFLEEHEVALLAFLADDEMSLKVRHRLGLVAAKLGVDAGIVSLAGPSHVADAFGVESAPMVLVFRKGEVVDRLIGAPPEFILEETVRARMTP
jgi:hypothetical protein